MTYSLGTFASILLAQADESGTGPSFLQFIHGGGVVGYIIIGLSIVGLAMVIIHLLQIRRKSLIPPEHVQSLDTLLAQGDIVGALEYCITPENDSFITRILAAGLTRYQKSAFGAFEIKTAIEEAGEEQTARLYRSTDALGVIGSISPLLGLLGTVWGMIGAFATVSRSAVNDANYYESLAGNISFALITTLQGLVVAIPCVALYTFFRNRIDAFTSEAAAEIERLVLHIESATPGMGAPGPARSAPRPTPAPPNPTIPGSQGRP